jgi:hypothetical protein
MKHQTFTPTDRLRATLSGDYTDTLAFAACLRAEIDDRLLRRLLWAAWVALGDEAAEEVADILMTGAGRPLQPLLDELTMQSARAWASDASHRELRAYAAATVERMRPADRSRLIAYVHQIGGRAAA